MSFFQLVNMEINHLIYDQNFTAINLPMLELTLRDPDNNVMAFDQLTEPVSIGFFHNLTFPVKKEVGPFLPPQNPGRPKRFGFYHSLWFSMGMHGLMIGVEPKVGGTNLNLTDMSYLLCLATGRFPNYTDTGGWDCDWWTVLPDSSEYHDALQWHHMSVMVSKNHLQLDCLFISLFNVTTMKKLRITGPLWGESMTIGNW